MGKDYCKVAERAGLFGHAQIAGETGIELKDGF